MVKALAPESIGRWLADLVSGAVREPEAVYGSNVSGERSESEHSPWSGPDVDNAFEDWRIEVKVTLEEHQSDLLDAWIAAHPLAFRQPYPDRWINNVYFDTPALRAYEENLAGLSTRRKLRLRWYGEETLPGSAVFEVKLRRNSLGAKHRTAVSLDAPASASWRQVKGQIEAQVHGRAVVDIGLMSQPVISNRYLRTYYVAEHTDVRLTVDRGVRFVDQRLSSFPRYGPAHVLEGYVVFEVKVPASQDPRRILRNLPMRLSRNSKYAIGVRTVLGGA